MEACILRDGVADRFAGRIDLYGQNQSDGAYEAALG